MLKILLDLIALSDKMEYNRDNPYSNLDQMDRYKFYLHDSSGAYPYFLIVAQRYTAKKTNDHFEFHSKFRQKTIRDFFISIESTRNTQMC